MNNQEILIRDLSKITPEKIYDFERKIIFSPLVTGNNNLTFALVKGKYLAKSENHTHPGDEVTLTLSGKAEISINDKKYFILPHTAIRVSPGQTHPLVVTSKEQWIALAVYCDNCPLIKGENKYIINKSNKLDIIKDISKIKFKNKNNLEIKKIFPASIINAGYLNLSVIKSYYANNNNKKHCYFGENIFLTLSGIAEIESKTKKYLLAPERAILISSKQKFSLKVIGEEPWIGINISCKYCSLLNIKTNKKNNFSYKEK